MVSMRMFVCFVFEGMSSFEAFEIKVFGFGTRIIQTLTQKVYVLFLHEYNRMVWFGGYDIFLC